MKDTLKKGIAVIGTVATLGVGGFTADIAIDKANIPVNEKLIIAKEEIIASSTKTYISNGKEVVKYAFKGDTVHAGVDELTNFRTDKVRVYTTKDPLVRKMRVYSPGSFIQENGVWYSIDSATTTKESFDLQTDGIFENLIKRTSKIVGADTSNIFETKDTYYGTSFSTGGRPDSSQLWYGGWSDHYYSYIEWDLTGTPTSAETTSAQVCLKVADIAANWADMQIRRVTASWTESGVTLAAHPTDAGATGQIDVTQPLVDESYDCTNITTYYENWKDGTWDNYGIVFADVGSNSNARGGWYSEDQTGTSDDPYLEITYTPSAQDKTIKIQNAIIKINNSTIKQ